MFIKSLSCGFSVLGKAGGHDALKLFKTKLETHADGLLVVHLCPILSFHKEHFLSVIVLNCYDSLTSKTYTESMLYSLSMNHFITPLLKHTV